MRCTLDMSDMTLHVCVFLVERGTKKPHIEWLKAVEGV